MVITISSSKKYYIPEFIYMYMRVYFSSPLKIIIENLLDKHVKKIYIYKIGQRLRYQRNEMDEIVSFSTRKTNFVRPWINSRSIFPAFGLITRLIPFSRAGSVREAALIGPGDAQMRVMACVIRTSRSGPNGAAAGI